MPAAENEVQIAVYGYFENGVSMVRSSAEKWAEQVVGSMFGLPFSGQFRIISTRLEDDPTDRSKGQVFATYQAVK